MLAAHPLYMYDYTAGFEYPETTLRFSHGAQFTWYNHSLLRYFDLKFTAISRVCVYMCAGLVAKAELYFRSILLIIHRDSTTKYSLRLDENTGFPIFL